jgi:transposase-like protein
MLVANNKKYASDPQVIELYQKGMSMRNISRMLKISLMSVRRTIILYRFQLSAPSTSNTTTG